MLPPHRVLLPSSPARGVAFNRLPAQGVAFSLSPRKECGLQLLRPERMRFLVTHLINHVSFSRSLCKEYKLPAFLPVKTVAFSHSPEKGCVLQSISRQRGETSALSGQRGWHSSAPRHWPSGTLSRQGKGLRSPAINSPTFPHTPPLRRNGARASNVLSLHPSFFTWSPRVSQGRLRVRPVLT